MFGMDEYDDMPPLTPDQLRKSLKEFEDSVREIEKDFPELVLARKIANQRWLIEQNESEHSIH